LVIDPPRRIRRKPTNRQHPSDRLESGVNRSNATAQPTNGAWQGDVMPTHGIGGGLHALGRGRHGDAVFDRSE
jgi:hypothetical protein